jgi:FkbM family methyltransferase
MGEVLDMEDAAKWHLYTFDDHVRIMNRLKNQGFNPKVIYDIGSAVLHWSKCAKCVWPDAKVFLFDAWDKLEDFYKVRDYEYNIGVLGNEDGKIVNFYQNDSHPWGNSYYKEIGTTGVFPESSARPKTMMKLDSVVKERGWPKPDLVKIDVQGAERDVIEGALETFKDTQYLIVEMQHGNYNEGAPKYDVTGPWLESIGWECIEWRFAAIGSEDADYLFRNLNSQPKLE